jgi:hypothetical protein
MSTKSPPRNEGVFVRVPPEAKEPLLELAKLLRDDSKILPRFRSFVREQGDPAAGSATLSMRVERLEADVQALKDRVVSGTPLPTPRPAAPAVEDQGDGQGDIEDLLGTRPHPAPQPTANPEWFNGKEGRARRLSEEGSAELERRIIAGNSDAEIAKAMGLAAFAVANRRKAMGRQSVTALPSQPTEEPSEG